MPEPFDRARAAGGIGLAITGPAKRTADRLACIPFSGCQASLETEPAFR